MKCPFVLEPNKTDRNTSILPINVSEGDKLCSLKLSPQKNLVFNILISSRYTARLYSHTEHKTITIHNSIGATK
jgi:hypothetical protein